MNKFVSRDAFIPCNIPGITEAKVDEVVTMLKFGWLAKDPHTAQFEKQFAEYLGAGYAVAANSCTAALRIALAAQDIGPGGEVITAPIAYMASANTVVHLGATPVLVDIDYRITYIDPDEIEKRITLGTKAIILVHYSGQVRDPDCIYEVVDKHNLFVSEDATYALWSRYKGRLIGDSLQGATSYSFYTAKNLCTSDGDMLITDDEETAVKARIFSNSGMSRNTWNRYARGGTWRYDIAEFSYKDNMFDIQAALGLAQLRRLEGMQEARLKIAARFQKAFGATDAIGEPFVPGYTAHYWHLYVIHIVPEVLMIDRDRFITELNKYNVGTSIRFILVHNMPAYTERFDYKPEDFPETQKHSERCTSLPLYPGLTDEQVQYITDAVADIAARYCKQAF